MVLRRKSYGFEAQELTGHELTGEFFRNYSWGMGRKRAYIIYNIGDNIFILGFKNLTRILTI